MKRPDRSHSTGCDDTERLEQYLSAWPTWPLELCIRFVRYFEGQRRAHSHVPISMGRWEEVVATSKKECCVGSTSHGFVLRLH